MNRIVQLFLLLLYLSATELHASGNATTAITGRVIDKDSRMPVAYATVFVVGNSQWYAATDTLGYFKIEGVTPGIYSLSAVCQGYNDAGNSYKCYPTVIQYYTNFYISFLSTICPRNFLT